VRNILIGLFSLILTNLSAQEKITADTNATHSIHGIVNEMLRIISGREGEIRDWKAFRNLFLPTAAFTVLNHSDSIPEPVETVQLEEFIELMHDEYYNRGYVEYETGKVVDEYNGIANVFQSFYSKDSQNTEGKGVTSYQLVYFNNRWWIVNVVWTVDSNGVEVPKKYLRH